MNNGFTRILWVWCILSCGVASAQTGWQLRRDDQRRSYASLMGSVPLLPQTKASQLMRLRVEDRLLVLRTPAVSTSGDGYARVRLEPAGADALVRVQGGSDTTDGEIVLPQGFQFTCNDYARPDRIVTLAVASEQSYLTISRSVQTEDGYSNVQLIERAALYAASGHGSVQLSMTRSDESETTSFSVEAVDFFQLVRDHPAEVNAYLRPLLRELEQEGAMAPDPLVAWQVFAENWGADGDVARRVNDLLPQLDSDDFRARERASKALGAMGREGAAVLVHLDRRTLSAEQNARVDRALAVYEQLPADKARRLRYDMNFLLDCMNCDQVHIRRQASAQLTAIAGATFAIDPVADSDTRAAATSAARVRISDVKLAIAPMP